MVDVNVRNNRRLFDFACYATGDYFLLIEWAANREYSFSFDETRVELVPLSQFKADRLRKGPEVAPENGYVALRIRCEEHCWNLPLRIKLQCEVFRRRRVPLSSAQNMAHEAVVYVAYQEPAHWEIDGNVAVCAVDRASSKSISEGGASAKASDEGSKGHQEEFSTD